MHVTKVLETMQGAEKMHSALLFAGGMTDAILVPAHVEVVCCMAKKCATKPHMDLRPLLWFCDAFLYVSRYVTC